LNVWKILKGAVVKGGPAAIALALKQPEIAATLAAASIAGDVTKYAGKAVEDRTGWRPHKIAAPAAAVGAGVVTVQALDPTVPAQICAVVGQLCADPALLATVPGLVMVLWQVIASGSFKVKPDGAN
jgi:hypothetical protein